MVELSEEVSAKLTELITKQVTRELIKQQSNTNSIANLVPISKAQPIKIVKTANMTYSEYLTKVLKQPTAIRAVGTGGRTSYRLVEDLHIISALSRQSNVSNKLFDDISRSGKINRSAESIRNRYNEVICHLSEDDMKRITEYLQKEGVQGYIVYQNEEIKITLKDPKENVQVKRVRQQAFDDELNIEKKAKRNVPANLSELNDTLAVYSKVVDIPIPELLSYLDKTSGDLIAFDRYIETKDERLLWTDQQDQLIKTGGASLEPLKRYRTDKDIQARKAYLGI